MKRKELQDTALGWSGGKDSSMALAALRRAGVEPIALLTTIAEESGCITVHGVPRDLLRRQADAVGVPLVEIPLPTPCPNDEYGLRMSAALATPPLDRARVIAFGDLFLADIREFREASLTAVGRRAVFPLWERPTDELALEFIHAGFRALVVSVDLRVLDTSYLGREYDASLLADLPAGTDPCAENGEFHTFVYAGPGFAHPIDLEQTGTTQRGDFAWLTLQPR